jgi:ribosomal RNA-processing protein 1
MRKLWRGLFFCMWMADKAPVQAELSGKIAKLIHCFDSAQGARQWLMIAARTVRDEWGKLDKYRVDKYYMLLRHLLAESFFWLGETSWEEESAGLLWATASERNSTAHGGHLLRGVEGGKC